MNMKKYKTKIFLTMILGLLSVCLFAGCSNNVEPGKFVAISTEGIIAYSTDGINWTERRDQLEHLTAPAQWFRICYGDGKFVALSFEKDGGEAATAYSTDGETWTTIKSASIHDNLWQSLTYGNGKFVAVSLELGKIAAYSTNGRDWNATENLPDNANWMGVCYGIGMFVAISNQGITAYSTDGSNWNTGEPLESGPGIYWESVCYGKGKFVAMTQGSSTAKVNVAYSTNGINWRSPVAESEWPDGYTGTWNASCYGNGKFVMLENGGDKAVYSTDGINWRPTTIDIGDWWYVRYGNGMFIAIAYDGKIAYSEDGINWNIGAKLSTPPASHSWQGLTYGLDSDVFGFL